eukprot:5371029-Amphidinium_carterae.1
MPRILAPGKMARTVAATLFEDFPGQPWGLRLPQWIRKAEPVNSLYESRDGEWVVEDKSAAVQRC